MLPMLLIVNAIRDCRLPLKLQIGALDLLERNLDVLAGSGFECNDPPGEAGQGAYPGALVIHWLAQRNLDLVADETLEVAGLSELALDARRADFERVMAARYDVLDI